MNGVTTRTGSLALVRLGVPETRPSEPPAITTSAVLINSSFFIDAAWHAPTDVAGESFNYFLCRIGHGQARDDR
jgi:hypothetical protein